MAQIKTAELEGVALDWAVVCSEYEGVVPESAFNNLTPPAFSTDWAQGGPIIEREGIAIDCVRCDGKIVNWLAARPPMDDELVEWDGITPLIAAMRCYVASKLGEVVEVPDELLKGK